MELVIEAKKVEVEATYSPYSRPEVTVELSGVKSTVDALLDQLDDDDILDYVISNIHPRDILGEMEVYDITSFLESKGFEVTT
ncbi:hypothetical protein [Pseudomonas phage vB_PaeM_RP7]|uniref:Uncharacterized protein n=1 Tax=Pseudomonas phage PAP-JP TaxID=2583508 RepID=A0A5C1K556_9CAUD|nr:hypothetical protein PAPJP_148 [Pseudomonas phage PAP-JP]UKH47990.1 MAG: hypothetical protein [Pseudomonas phage RP4]WAB56736.1 hypothetical protein [Pseudomonas phage vB_PaeM_RP15]WAB57022.1 hypothetical protein [Pseudomonas phage vB_PaeM_RP6]WAB57069.1 hypothetical protein [Pseudomonas phage vB_PaeM_RP7]WAB57378.1 hypothetical protein [Pseudomonas phage vB_PaeM_RP8]WAB57532.1 hypothetical protein [Pseudomonas phage vB_PaeM_RP9]WAB57649.1 hypothetical protein [Pseudomonas phage vB_PaeM_R